MRDKKDIIEVREADTRYREDIQHQNRSDKGRCDILPLDVVAGMMDSQLAGEVLVHINNFLTYDDVSELYQSLYSFSELRGRRKEELILEVSSYYSDKYRQQTRIEDKMEQRMEQRAYIDSAIRSYLKFLTDPETDVFDLAFVYNMMEAIRSTIRADASAVSKTSDSERVVDVAADDLVTIPRSQLNEMLGVIGGVYDAVGVPLPEIADTKK